MFFRILKRLAVAAVIGLAPLSASAITFFNEPVGPVSMGDVIVVTAVETGSAGGPSGTHDIVLTPASGGLKAVVELVSSFGLPAPTFSFDPAGGGLPATLTVAYGATTIGDNFTFKISIVPLPAGALLLLTGLGGFALLRRRQTGAAAA